MQRLSKSAKVARVVLVSSEAHRWAKASEIDATLHGLMNPPPYSTTNAFDQYSRCAVPSIVRMRLHVIYALSQEQASCDDLAMWRRSTI